MKVEGFGYGAIRMRGAICPEWEDIGKEVGKSWILLLVSSLLLVVGHGGEWGEEILFEYIRGGISVKMG